MATHGIAGQFTDRQCIYLSSIHVAYSSNDFSALTTHRILFRAQKQDYMPA